MSENAWTKGNWMAAAKPSSVVGWPVVAAPLGRVICDVCMNPDAEANARLIAAAPDLYEALEAMLPENCDRGDDPAGLLRPSFAKCEAARAALAKATAR